MTLPSNWALALLLWAVGLIPVALLVQWLGLVEWTWQGFGTAYALLAVISFSYEFFVRWIERRLARRRERSDAASTSEH